MMRNKKGGRSELAERIERVFGDLPVSVGVCCLCEHSDYTEEDSKACQECCFFYGSKLVVKEGSYEKVVENRR